MKITYCLLGGGFLRGWVSELGGLLITILGGLKFHHYVG